MPSFIRQTFNILARVFLFYLVQQCLLAIDCEGTEFTVSLHGSYSPYETVKGTVFISADGGQEQKLCLRENIYNFDAEDWNFASVICRQMGRGPLLAAERKRDDALTTWNSFSSGVWTCSGLEESLSDCFHTTDAGGSCYALEMECLPAVATEFTVAVGTDSADGGTVFAFVNGRWGTICSREYYGDEIAQAACRQAGYTDGMQLYVTRYPFEDPVLSISWCNYGESNLMDCRYDRLSSASSVNCLYDYDILTASCYNRDNTSIVTYDNDDGEYAVASSVSGVFFFLILCCCVGGICYCACCKRSNRRSNGPNMAQTTTSVTSPPLVVPPPPYKDVVPPPGQAPTVVYPPPGSNQGYPQPGGPGYQPVPTQPPGYPPSGGPGYPPSGGPGYPPAPGSGYPPAPGSGYHPTGYPSPSSVPPPGYPPPEYPPVGAPSNPLMAGPGYPTQSNPASFSGTSAPPYPGDIQLQPYPVNEKQGPPDQSSYQQGPPDQSSYQGVTPYPTAPGPPEEHQPPMATAPPIEKEVFDKV